MEEKSPEGRTIDVTIVSATDLKKVKKFGREQKCYAVAHIYPAVKQTTPLDNYGGVNPIWNATVALSCYEAHLHPPNSIGHGITVEIFCHSTFRGHDRLVGTARVPFANIPAIGNGKGVTHEPYETMLDVVLPSGGVEGSLNVSVKVGPKRVFEPYEDPSASRLEAFSSDQEAPKVSETTSSIVPSAPPISEETLSD